MDTSLLLKGLLIGFSIAAPVGPIGVLCIRRTLAQGRAAGLISGLGAATADALFAAPVLVFFGLLVGQPLTLVFTPLEVVAVGVSVLIAAYLALRPYGHRRWALALLAANYVWAWVDRDRRFLHDRLAGTRLVRTGRARQATAAAGPLPRR